MFKVAVASLCLSVATPVWANPTEFDFEFSSVGGGQILDDTVRWFEADPANGTNFLGGGDAANLEYSFIQLEIVGLTHTSPMDLNIFLLDPFGGGIEIIDDNGDQQALSGVTLIFADKGPNDLPIGSDGFLDGESYFPVGPGSFSDAGNTGNAPWRLVIIDDAAGGEGSFDSFTLRGVIVPEPATVSLLAIGAIAVLRRRRN